MAILVRSLGRTGAIVLACLFAVCALALVGVASAHKSVTVRIDGAQRSLTTYADTVDGALKDAAVRVGEHDVVRPGRWASLRSGQVIDIATARRLAVTTAQGAQWRWSGATTAIAALAKLEQGATLPLAHSGVATLPLTDTATTVRIRHDGTTGDVRAAAGQTAARVLAAAGVELGALDRVSLVREGQVPVLVVDRVGRAVETSDQVTARPLQRVADPTLARGETRVKQAGSDQVVRTTTFTQTVNGRVEHSAVAGRQQISALAAKVVAVGTKGPDRTSQREEAPAPAAPSSPAADSAPAAAPGGVWAALAKCESGGNPRSVSSNGRYHGLYQFTVSTWRSVGGQGLPSQASPAEQTKRAKILQQRSGWGQWPACSRKIGVR